MEKKKVECPKDNSSAEKSETGETMSSSDFEKPFIKKFPPIPGEEDLPCVENDFCRAKAYLMKQCLSSGDNLWDHLNEVLEKILVEQPKNIGCTFEEFSYKVKECRFRAKTDHLLDIFVPARHHDLSQKLLQLLQPSEEEFITDKTETDDDGHLLHPDLLETFYYFEQGGVSLPYEEIFCMALHLKKLMTGYPVVKYRFWGKILGTRKNYFVAETEVTEEEMARLNAEREEEEEMLKLEKQKKEEAELEEREKEFTYKGERSHSKFEGEPKEGKSKEFAELQTKDIPGKEELNWPPIPPLPMAHTQKTVECPVEPTGTGVNKKVYYVCQEPGDDWVALPDVTPEQIVTARKIKRAFTGDLEAEVTTFPSFPGKEKNLLRAQIARISAGTQISPLGYFTFNEEEEEEEAEPDLEEGKTNYLENPDFEPVTLRDLTDPSMAFWVHHTQYILEQGRTVWWNPNEKKENIEEEGEIEDEDLGKEIGPELLTPLSEDSAVDTIVPWSVRKTSSLFPENAVAIVRSNLWPGAYAYAAGKKFGNIYIGYGYKFTATNHSPVPMQEIQEEYPVGPEIMEILDPTPEQEEDWMLAHRISEEGTEDEKKDEDSDADADNDEDD